MISSTAQRAALFNRVRHWKALHPTVAHLFPTNDSLRWFIRQNESRLVEAQALFKFARGNYIDPEAFAAVAMDLLTAPTTSEVVS